MASGFAPADLSTLPEAATVLLLPDPTDDGFLETAYDALAGRDDDRRVLVVHAAARESTRRVHMVRSMLTTTDVVPLPVRRPPTGLAATTAWLAALAARGISAGTALAAVEEILGQLPSYAVTTSVAGLEMREVRLRHHMLSWLPGTTFAISLDDAGPRVGLGAVDRARAKRTLPTGPCDVVFSGDQRLAGRLAATLPVGAEHHVVPEDHGATWWKRARYYEHTVVPRDVDAFAEGLRDRPLRPCPQCGDAMDRSCSFCHALEGTHA